MRFVDGVEYALGGHDAGFASGGHHCMAFVGVHESDRIEQLLLVFFADDEKSVLVGVGFGDLLSAVVGRPSIPSRRFRQVGIR